MRNDRSTSREAPALIPRRMLREAPAASSISLGKNVTSVEGCSVIAPRSSSDQVNSVTSNRNGALLVLRSVRSALVVDVDRSTSVGVTTKFEATAGSGASSSATGRGECVGAYLLPARS